MSNGKSAQVDTLRRYANLIQKQTGRVVRPYRADGYVNLMNKYGTSRDASERYKYEQEPQVPDDMLTMFYEGNGLFAKIIDSPAEESIKNGFTLEGLKDQKIEDFYMEALDELDWEETVVTAIKWARLFGGSIAVMLINDGRGLEEPLDWRNIRSIDDIRVYDRSLIQPDYKSMFNYSPVDPFATRGSRLGMPEYYDVFSKYGTFRVHDSRCLVFQNGLLPENTTNSIYQLWGIPEYVRLNRAIRDAEIAHGTAPKLLDRSVQAIYKMKDLSTELATEEGEDRVLRRLQTIDMARGLLNSITIDSEGEDYDFRQFQFAGVSDVIDSTCNFLSALTSIPQTILFGRSPAGMNSTGASDMENWYNYLTRIQKRMIKKNLRYLLSIIFQAGIATGEIDEVPPIKIGFNPLWSLSEQEQASLEQTRASTQQAKAATAQIYVDMQAIDPSEVRKKLADSEEFDVENMLDEYDEEDLFANMPQGETEEGETGESTGMSAENPAENPQNGNAGYNEAASVEEHDTDTNGNAPAAAPAATKLPQDMSDEEKADIVPGRTDTHIHADGGPGSGNFNHKGVPGQVGGSAPSEYGSVSDRAKEIIGNAKRNGFILFGVSDEESLKMKSELTEELRKSGVTVIENEDEDPLSPFRYKAYSADLSLQECQTITKTLNCSPFCGSYTEEEYLEFCKEQGKEPRLAEKPDEVPTYYFYTKSGKLQHDGTPVYGGLDNEKLLSDAEILKFSGNNSLLSDGCKEAEAAAKDAIESMTKAEVNALNNYTKQFSGESYREVNHYLATGEGGENVKAAAEHITSALDHNIGVDCITCRGDSEIHGSSIDAKANKLIQQIAKGNFSNAGKLKEMLEGKVCTNDAAMSTSPHRPLEGFGSLPVQYIFKTPADAKAVDISEISAFGGGRSEVEKALANTGLFGSVSYESEVLYKPGAKYKIDRVEFSTDVRNKKKNGQIFIVASILTGNSDGKDHREDNGFGSVGVYVVNSEGKILSGTRKNGDGSGLVCGPGGHIDPGETPGQAAIRETQEEFGITPMELIPIGLGTKEAGGLQPHIFVCFEWEGTPKTDDDEMTAPVFRRMGDYESNDANLFGPFREGLKQLKKVVYESIDGDEDSLENILDFTGGSATIKSGNNLDGAPEGNQNAAGPHRMRGGSQVDPEIAKQHLNEKLKNGTLKKRLDTKKQSKHTKGSPRYNKAVASGQYVSTIDLSNDEVHELINRYSGTGKVYEVNGHFKETFEHTEKIGTYYDKNGNASPTNRGTIHYSKDGAHLVPAKPKKKIL